MQCTSTEIKYPHKCQTTFSTLRHTSMRGFSSCSDATSGRASRGEISLTECGAWCRSRAFARASACSLVCYRSPDGAKLDVLPVAELMYPSVSHRVIGATCRSFKLDLINIIFRWGNVNISGPVILLQYKVLTGIVFVFQLTVSSVESSAAMRSMWLLPHPLVVYRRTWLRMWTTASPCGRTPCAPGGRRAAAGATWSTIQPSSALRSYSLSITAPATGPPPPPKSPARLAPPRPSCVTTRAGSSCRAQPLSKRNTPTVDYSETPTYALSETNFRPARLRGRGL